MKPEFFHILLRNPPPAVQRGPLLIVSCVSFWTLFHTLTFTQRYVGVFAVSFVFTLGREILMDIRDSAGDSVITGNKRMKKGAGWTVSSLLILTAFLLMEMIYFERFIPRYILIFVVCIAFVFLFWNKKKKIWLCTEIVKLWFLINLVCLLLGI